MRSPSTHVPFLLPRSSIDTLLVMLVAWLVSVLLTLLPITIDSSVPYASSSRMIVATVIALAVYGWHTALGGRPMLGAGFFRD